MLAVLDLGINVQHYVLNSVVGKILWLYLMCKLQKTGCNSNIDEWCASMGSQMDVSKVKELIDIDELV